MKYILILLALTVISPYIAYSQKDKLVTINGKLGSTGNVTQIYLDTLTQTGSQPCASAPVNADGSFALTARIERTNIFKLKLDDQNYLMLILSPGENVDFLSPTMKLGVDALIKGSPQSEMLYRNINLLHYFDVQRDSLNKKYNEVMGDAATAALGTAVISAYGKNDSLQKVVLKSEFEKMPASLAWIFLEDKFDMSADFPLVDRMDKSLYENYPYVNFVQQFHQQVETERKTAIGSLAPEITLNDPEGNPKSLSSLRGKVVLIDFWASWCGPCRKENPNVVKAYAKFHDKGFEVFSVSLDKDRESWLKAIATDKLIWPNHVSDLKYWKSAGAAAYGVTSIPNTFLLDQEGRIVAKKLRGDALEEKLSELLK